MEYAKQTANYWTDSAERYSDNIRGELCHAENEVWTKLILENAPQKEKLKILDIGTGPGFFAIILSAAGHDVTAIDVTQKMLDEAQKNAATAGVAPEFLLMDSHRLDFADRSFDLIVSRNVTWTLYDPNGAYAEWKRVLKPGGRLLIFDANWYMNFFDTETDRKFKEGMKVYREKHGSFPEGFSMYEIEDYWLKLPLIGIRRPDWDKATLWKLGFTDIRCVCDLDDLVYTADNADKRLIYGATPMFMVSADKP